jgi:hypothetical protein
MDCKTLRHKFFHSQHVTVFQNSDAESKQTLPGKVKASELQSCSIRKIKIPTFLWNVSRGPGARNARSQQEYGM